MKSSRYYDQHARTLSDQYNAIEAGVVHRSCISRHLPEIPGFACDIGAGSGRDANWLASIGWDMVAAEPSCEMRVLTRIAEGAPGIVVNRTDDYVDIPLGIVGLYWLKQYKPLLLTHKIPQHPNTRQGYGFAREAFYQLHKISNYDLRVGTSFDAELGAVITEAIRDACKSIAAMPVRHITYPGQNATVFECQPKAVRKSRNTIVLSKSYLARFGIFRIPAELWQTLGQYACWLEPAILQEWSRLTRGWGIADYSPTDMKAFAWEEGKRDTGVAASRVVALRDGGMQIACVWSGRRVNSPHIDHCFPWVRWLNNDMWNLLPSSATVNASKGDRLPSAFAVADARKRILEWWQYAYLDSPLRKKFLLEAGSSLPMLFEEEPDLDDIFEAMLHQRARLKSDQQLLEWSFHES